MTTNPTSYPRDAKPPLLERILRWLGHEPAIRWEPRKRKEIAR